LHVLQRLFGNFVVRPRAAKVYYAVGQSEKGTINPVLSQQMTFFVFLLALLAFLKKTKRGKQQIPMQIK
jgi:hypothetical protein